MLSPTFALQGMLGMLKPSFVSTVHLPPSTYTTLTFSVTMLGIKFQNGKTIVDMMIIAAAIDPYAKSFSFMCFDRIAPLFRITEPSSASKKLDN